MRDIKDSTYLIIFVGLLLFGVGYYLFWGKRISLGKRTILWQQYYFRYNIILILQVLCLAFLLMVSMRTIQYLFSDDGWNVVRNMYQGYSDESIFKSKWESVFNSIILGPFMLVNVCILGILVFERNAKTHKAIFSLSIINLVLYCIMNAGRILLVYVAIVFMLLMSLYGMKIKLNRKQKLLILIFLAILAGATFYITSSRRSTIKEWDIVHQIYSYFSITPAIFDYWREYIESHDIWTYGMYFLNGFFSIFRLIYSKLGIEFDLKATVEEIIALTETFIPVFSQKNYNAFVSIFFCFYSDFRILGVIIGSFFLGGFAEILYGAVKDRKNHFYLIIFLLLAYGLFKTITKWEGTSPVYVYAFIWSRLLVKKDSNSRSVHLKF